MGMMLSAKNVDISKREEIIFYVTKKNVMKMQRNGTPTIENISMQKPEKGMQKIIQLLLNVTEDTLRRLKLNIWYNHMCAEVKSLSQQFALFAIVNQNGLKGITQIIPNLWKLFGYVINAITISINLLKNVCSLNDQTLWTYENTYVMA